MAKQLETTPLPAIPDQLLAVGNAVVVTPGGARIQLGGELTAEQREALGDAKIRSLMTAGHLQTQEQLDEADAIRDRLADGNAASRGRINPNFGTPSMTPEGIANATGKPIEGGVVEADESKTLAERNRGVGNADQAGFEATSVDDLGLDARTVESLKSANLNSVGDVLKYGHANDGLTSIDGVGDATEARIKEAIAAKYPRT